jgi:hypothetical protein
VIDHLVRQHRVSTFLIANDRYFNKDGLRPCDRDEAAGDVQRLPGAICFIKLGGSKLSGRKCSAHSASQFENRTIHSGADACEIVLIAALIARVQLGRKHEGDIVFASQDSVRQSVGLSFDR